MFHTLDEAAARLTDLCRDRHPSFAGPVTSRQILQYGIHGQLTICVGLDTDAHCPRGHVEIPLIKYRDGPAGRIARLFGLFRVPPRVLFALDSSSDAPLEMVTTVDGAACFLLGMTITGSKLRVRDKDLKAFAAGLHFVAGAPQPHQKPVTRSVAQVNAIRATIKALGYDESALPTPRGRAGVKAEVWALVQHQKDIFVSRVPFDKAWKLFKKQCAESA